MTGRPEPDEYREFYHTYVSKVSDGDILDTLERQIVDSVGLLERVAPDREAFAYQPGKWTIRESVGHVIDAERVFAQRALWFARGAPAPLPGFDQDEWVPASGASGRRLPALLAEWRAVRASTLHLFAGLTPESWGHSGVASGGSFSVRSLAWIIAGHEAHHHCLFIDRYGLRASSLS